ncbi:uncharacterized protein Z520_12090 [Fonsecaea multimorphosa CBS 102226]|uniref:Uncharacterized protein n=1 Tax=Fonsecaea multimorphosa CBS 102226 TaxID=1442371 RepID=A0A0D2JP01_9EURO|nr:uncharacterized protein Z520_12090 [Fonsecaea multimorphosa CBS 102226]KIX92209.1 hypothetical protein Z520_12090 [Fonsecaea multimorphosa CBS 102226]OAL17585.1 hypothetical protein AYO22_11503 [Fonsecaea multimorphosa]
MPGHVAQMQKLFQSAKASFRLDVRFAASPVGSVGSRLPPSPGTEHACVADPDLSQDPESEASQNECKDWRYSRAPRSIAEFDMDVREPFPEGSPQLPDLLSVEMDCKVLAVEPPSSGFTSPVDEKGFAPHLKDTPNLSSSLAKRGSRSSTEKHDNSSPPGHLSTTDLERPLTELRVSADYDLDIDSAEESPIITHLQRKSAEIEGPYRDSSSSAGEGFVLSPTVKAAADSAKLKRRMFSDLFPKPPTHNGSGRCASSSGESQHADIKPCPDPLLHARGPTVLCPDPTAHFRSLTPNVPGHQGVPSASNAQGSQGRQYGLRQGFACPPVPFSRASATGSPMPLLRARSPAKSPGGIGHNAWNPPAESSQSRSHHEHINRTYLTTASEHFQPGWYYAKESPHPSPRPGPAMYSFSTAAAKVVGQDPAPDSRIRDSYRTDTLTPLAKPPSRFRKNGIIALARARGVAKHYGDPPYSSRPPQRRMQRGWSHLPDNMQFRSSPPRSSVESALRSQPKKRSRETETPRREILEPEEAATESIDPKLKLEEGEEVIEVDEETRAAVRMSLFGTPAPSASSDTGRGMKELSPNVMIWRKGAGPPVSRKKRRPSYWDADLEEVMRSPAARHVVSSPIKKDDVRSERAEVESQDDGANKENQMLLTQDDLEDVSRVAEGPTNLEEDVSMENEDLSDAIPYY